MNTYKKDLHSLFLKHDQETTSLSKIALKNIVVKLFFLLNKLISYSEIKKELKDLINCKVNNDDLKDVLKELRNKELEFENDKYKITQATYKTIERHSIESNTLLNNVLDKWFKNIDIIRDELKEWFQTLLINYFEEYYYHWIDDLCRKRKNKQKNLLSLNEFIKKSFSGKNFSSQDKEWLSGQIIKFLLSEDHEDNLVMWLFGTSLFSATLIQARNYADQISIELFKNSTFILDTNVLMSLNLEGNELAESLITLEKIILELKINTKYLRITREEYLRAIENRKDQIKKAFSKFRVQVLEETKDQWIKTAIKRGCQTEEDLETFFEQITQIPIKFYEELEVNILDYEELDDIIMNAEKDQNLKDKINKIHESRKYRGEKKRELPLNHDAALIKVAEHLRKDDPKIWIVTKDETLKKYAIDNTKRNDYPIAAGLDVLLNLFAVDNAGINIDSEKFAPLFANIIRLSLIDHNTSFELADLSYILNKEIEIGKLNDTDAVEIIKEVNHMRFKSISDEQIGLYLRRKFETSKLRMRDDLEQTAIDLHITEKEKKKEKTDKEFYRSKYFSEKKRTLLKKFRNNLTIKIIMFVIIFLLVAILSYILNKIYNTDNKSVIVIIAILVNLITDLSAGFLILPKAIKDFIYKKKNIENIAFEQIEEEKKILESKNT